MKGLIRWSMLVVFSPVALLVILCTASAAAILVAWLGLSSYAAMFVDRSRSSTPAREPSRQGPTR